MKTVINIIILFFLGISAKAQINRYSKPTENHLETYTSSDLSALSDLAKVAQINSENNARAQVNSFIAYYKEIKYFKRAEDLQYPPTIIVDNIYKFERLVGVVNNRVVSVKLDKIYTVTNGLKVPSEIEKGYCKVFVEINGTLKELNLYFTSLFSNNPN